MFLYVVMTNRSTKYTNLLRVLFLLLTGAAITGWARPATLPSASGTMTATSVAENSITAGNLLFTVTAVSDRNGNHRIQYSLESSTDSVGIIDASSDAVTLATGKILDYENAAFYVFVIT